jgi:DNA-binding response OmpR family regulator
VLSRIRERYPKLQVIFLSAKSQTFDKILGLDLGADDYITKPFQKEELMARVKSHLRRYQDESASTRALEIYRYEKLCFNPQERNLTISDARVDITRTEFLMLSLLSSVPGKVFTRDEILDHVWKDTIVSERTIDVHIRRLRKKLEKYSHLIKAHSGFGYSIERP